MTRNFVSALRKHALRAATWTYRLAGSRDSVVTGLRILTYHAVGTSIRGDRRLIYNIAPARFEEHMRHLAHNHGDELVGLDCSSPAGARLRIAMTFDDGYRDNLMVAAPRMSALGIPFTVFVCTGAVAGRRAGFLSPEEVRELATCPGATIGSHTVGHPRLTDCTEDRVKEELVGSKAYLEDLLGSKVDSLAYPHGAVNFRVRDMAELAGYRIGASTRFDINRDGRDPLLLCRTDIWADDGIRVLEEKLRGDWDWNRWRSADPAAPGELRK